MARKFVVMLGLFALALGLGGCSQTEETCCALPPLDPEEFQRSGDSQFGTYDIGAPGAAQCEVTTREDAADELFCVAFPDVGEPIGVTLGADGTFQLVEVPADYAAPGAQKLAAENHIFFPEFYFMGTEEYLWVRHDGTGEGAEVSGNGIEIVQAPLTSK